MRTHTLQTILSKKFLPSLAMQFLLVLSYILLQDLKVKSLMETGLYDTLALAHVWGGLPLSLLFVMAYFKVVNTFERRHHLMIFLIPFALFFLCYAHIFLPHSQSFHITTETTKNLLTKYPGFSGLIYMYAHWATSLFMMLVDIWSNFVVGVLFWQFMNDHHGSHHARITYPLLGLSLAVFTSLSLAFSAFMNHAATSYNSYAQYSVTLIVFLWIGVLWVQKQMLKNQPQKPPQLKLSMMETVGHVFTSKYLGYMAIMVISFGVMLNLLDRSILFYKTLLLQTHLTHLDMPKISLIIAFMSFCTSGLMALLSVRLLQRKNGWFKAALATPIIIGITALVLFCASLVKHTPSSASTLFVLMVFAIIAIKQVKPFFFKPTKEMAYMPLDADLQLKGKATIDLVVERFAVAFGTPIFSLLTFFTLGSGTKINLLSLTALITLVLCGIYFMCIRKLAPEFEKMS